MKLNLVERVERLLGSGKSVVLPREERKTTRDILNENGQSTETEPACGWNGIPLKLRLPGEVINLGCHASFAPITEEIIAVGLARRKHFGELKEGQDRGMAALLGLGSGELSIKESRRLAANRYVDVDPTEVDQTLGELRVKAGGRPLLTYIERGTCRIDCSSRGKREVRNIELPMIPG